MTCLRCGKELEAGSKFCNACGAAQVAEAAFGAGGYGAGYVPPQAPPYGAYGTPYRGPMMRPRYDRKVAGVCGAVARQMDMDVTLVRVIAVILFLVWGSGLLAYVIGWLVIPEEPYALAPGFIAPAPPPVV